MKLRPQAETLYGLPQPTNTGYIKPIVALRAPTSSDTGYPIGQIWVDKTNANYYGLSAISAGAATWSVLGGSSSAVATLTGDSGTATPSSGNIQIAGTSNQISSSASGAVVTLSLPAAITAPGSITATTSVSSTTTMTAGTDLSTTTGNLIINGSAKQLQIKGGAATDFIGQATLTAGVATVLNTNIAAGDKIFVSRQGINGSTALGVFDVAITASTSFTITARNPTDASTQTNDTSIVDYVIIKQI